MKKLVICFAVASTLSGCAGMQTMSMSKVIDLCNTPTTPIPQVSSCIRETYNTKGNTPNANSVKAFYSELAVIDEDYKAKNITDAQARAGIYRAYANTVEKSNRANKGTTCLPINGMVFCQ